MRNDIDLDREWDLASESAWESAPKLCVEDFTFEHRPVSELATESDVISSLAEFNGDDQWTDGRGAAVVRGNHIIMWQDEPLTDADKKDAVAEYERTLGFEEVEENVLNSWLEQYSELLWATVDSELESAGLGRGALACLDDEDQCSLASFLASAAIFSLRNCEDVRETLRVKLVEWLQDWTETNEDNLAVLVRLARSICPLRQRGEEESVNWSNEGF